MECGSPRCAPTAKPAIRVFDVQQTQLVPEGLTYEDNGCSDAFGATGLFVAASSGGQWRRKAAATCARQKKLDKSTLPC